MISSQPKQQMSVSGISPASVVLYIADDSAVSVSHSSSLSEAGYALHRFAAQHAIQEVEQLKPGVVVIGHGVSLEDREQIEDVVRRLCPKPRLVMLYDTSIAQTELADAVLNINSEPQHLVQTIRYLLTGHD